MPDAADPSGSVHSGRFIQFRVHAGNSRQIQDGIPAGFFPEIQPGPQLPEGIGLLQQMDRRQAQSLQQVVQHAAVAQNGVDQRRDNNIGKKMGQIGKGLNRFF